MEVDNTQNPVSIGYTPAQGSISGFDQIIDDTLTTILKKGWSKEQLHQAILNLREQVGVSGVQTLLKLLSAHLADYNNPHKVTIAQVASDVIAQFLNPILPGTPPSTPPIFALYPELPVDMEFLPVVYSGASGADGTFGFQVPNAAGYYANKANTVIPTGLRGPAPIIPMITAVDQTGLSVALTPLTGSAVSDTAPSLSPIATGLAFSEIVADNTSPTAVGVQIAVTAPDNASPTITLYVVPDSKVTTLLLTRGTATIAFDIAAGTASSDTPSTDIGDIERLPNGVYRITHSFVQTTALPITIAASLAGSVAYTENQPAFAYAPAQITNTDGSVPPLVSGETAITKSTLTSTFLDVLDTDVTMSLTLASLPNPSRQETPILTFGGITLSTTASGYKIGTNTGTVYFHETSQAATFVRMAFSLSKTRLCIKFRGETKFIALGDFSALIPTTNSFTMTDFQGDIRDMAIYAESDRDQLLEFLTDA